jgi:hypothetical protein
MLVRGLVREMVRGLVKILVIGLVRCLVRNAEISEIAEEELERRQLRPLRWLVRGLVIRQVSSLQWFTTWWNCGRAGERDCDMACGVMKWLVRKLAIWLV